MQQTSIIVDVSYKLGPSSSIFMDCLDQKLDDIAFSTGGKFFGSGTGFGERDLGYEFPNNECAENFRKQCREKGFKVWD